MDLARRTFDEQVSDAAAWLAVHARPTTGRPTWSYAAKHAVQAWAGRYVSSAALVEAARLAGFRTVGTRTRAGNAWLALSVSRHRPEHLPSTGGLNEA